MSSEMPNTRERILSACWKLLEASQGKGVRMTDIAREAGISRQALYLHFSKRAELLIATTRYIDEVKDVESMLIPSRSAKTGVECLDAYIEAWGNYIPEIYGVASALLAMRDTEEDAELAWNDRMQALREGCEAVVADMKRGGSLLAEYTMAEASDILWTLISVRNWEQLTIECGWSQAQYIEKMKSMVRLVLVVE